MPAGIAVGVVACGVVIRRCLRRGKHGLALPTCLPIFRYGSGMKIGVNRLKHKGKDAMPSIILQITRCAHEYEMSTGLKPTRIYLGRQETLALGKWAHGEGHQSKPGTAAREGMERPEIMGLPVYVVNDDAPHMRCCA
jgi:hypothetical protein